MFKYFSNESNINQSILMIEQNFKFVANIRVFNDNLQTVY